MTTVSNSEDLLGIQMLVAKFDDAVNRRDPEEFCALWTDDAVWEIGTPRELKVVGIDNIRSTWQKMLSSTVWLFRGSFVGTIDVSGETASGRWPCVETGAFKDEGKYDNYALYEDEYKKIDGVWRFSRRRYVYLRLTTDIIPS